jgi:hypothetical protein
MLEALLQRVQDIQVRLVKYRIEPQCEDPQSRLEHETDYQDLSQPLETSNRNHSRLLSSFSKQL